MTCLVPLHFHFWLWALLSLSIRVWLLRGIISSLWLLTFRCSQGRGSLAEWGRMVFALEGCCLCLILLFFLLLLAFVHFVELLLRNVAASHWKISVLLFLLQKPIQEIDVLDLQLRQLDALYKPLQLIHSWWCLVGRTVCASERLCLYRGGVIALGRIRLTRVRWRSWSGHAGALLSLFSSLVDHGDVITRASGFVCIGFGRLYGNVLNLALELHHANLVLKVLQGELSGRIS